MEKTGLLLNTDVNDLLLVIYARSTKRWLLGTYQRGITSMTSDPQEALKMILSAKTAVVIDTADLALLVGATSPN